MIKVKLGTILDSVPTMNELIEQRHLEIKVAYKIARLARELQKETELFQTTRAALVNKYGEKDKDGNLIEQDGNFLISKEYRKNFTKEFNELIQQEVEINAEKLKLEELEKTELTPQQILSLMEYIEE